jgi:hypothetical protein
VNEDVKRHYLQLAKRLEAKAPAQARLLRYFILMEGQPKEAIEVAQWLGCSEDNFHVLVGKLRGKGAELVCTRTHRPGHVNEDVKHVYSLSTPEVADWETVRKKAIITAWERMSSMFVASLENLGLEPRAIGDIEGQMKAVRLIINNLDFRVGVDFAQAKAALEAAEEQAALEAVEIEEAPVEV